MKHLHQKNSAAVTPRQWVSLQGTLACTQHCWLTSAGWSGACSSPTSRATKPAPSTACVHKAGERCFLFRCTSLSHGKPHLTAGPRSCYFNQRPACNRFRGRHALVEHLDEEWNQRRNLMEHATPRKQLTVRTHGASRKHRRAVVPQPGAASARLQPTRMPPKPRVRQLSRKGRRVTATGKQQRTKNAQRTRAASEGYTPLPS